MKKSIFAIILVLCVVIVGLSMINNASFNKDKQYKDALEAQRDSLLNKQIESQDSLFFEIKLLDSMSNECNNNISLIQDYLQHSKNETDKILKLQKQKLRKSK